MTLTKFNLLAHRNRCKKHFQKQKSGVSPINDRLYGPSYTEIQVYDFALQCIRPMHIESVIIDNLFLFLNFREALQTTCSSKNRKNFTIVIM